MLTSSIAAICHEANRAYCATIGDTSQPTWALAPEWQRASAIEGVEKILSGAIKTPDDSHKSWLAHKETEGWVYGEIKDAERKTHPCMVEYNQLPKEQRMKDYIFHGIVHAIMNGEASA